MIKEIVSVDVPKVGDKVGLHYRGEVKPEGEIATISDNMYTLTTTTGKLLYRRGNTWRCHGWVLVYTQ